MGSIYRQMIIGFLAFCGLIRPVAAATGWIALFPAGREAVLHESSVPVWDREEGIVIAGPSDEQIDALRAKGIEPVFSARDNGEGIHVLSHDRFFTPPVLPEIVRFEISDHSMLYLIPAGLQMDLPRLKLHGLFHGVPRVALPPVRVHPADAAAPLMSPARSPISLVSPVKPAAGGMSLALTPNTLVQQIVNATS